MQMPRRRGALLVGLFLLAAAVRLAVPAVRGAEEHHRRGYDYYVEMAQHVVDGEGFYRTLPYGHGDRRAIRTPIYPLVLAGFLVLGVSLSWGAIVFGAACGAVTVLCVAGLARHLFGETAAVLAALVAVLWPYGVVHDTALQDTSLYTALFLAAHLVLWTLAVPAVGNEAAPDESASGLPSGRAALLLGLAAGALAAAAILTRVALAPTLVAALAWCAWRRAGRVPSRALRPVGVAVLALATGLAPWIVRNTLVLGRPALTSDFGRSFWLGNNPQTFSVYPAGSIDRAEERAWAALAPEQREAARALSGDELASDAWFAHQGLTHVREHPARAAWGAVRKAWATYTPWFNPRGGTLRQLVHALSYGPVALLALAAFARFRARWRDLLPVPLAVALLALQSAVFFGHSSYRAYVDPLLVVLAAGLVARWLEARRSGGAESAAV